MIPSLNLKQHIHCPARSIRPDTPSHLSAGFGMLAVLSVMFIFALPYPRKFKWVRNTAVGRVLNDYDW